MKNLYNALLLKQLYLLKNLGYNYTKSAICTIDAKSQLTLPNEIQALRQQALNCHLCELSKYRKKVVFGEGNPNAQLMFISEPPSAAEDSSGHPFAGRSGEMLEKMIVNVLKLERSDIYLTNIIKCRPPNNRLPNSMEINSCYPYLQKQLEIISPSIIVTLG
ncbi:MAG TPA: uracil-DNA glycosylase, partial [Epsilonproteobacteria bacterium]|nr:uracil-DNA glycosylase [Campylobacterota bacterium]